MTDEELMRAALDEAREAAAQGRGNHCPGA